MSLVELLVGLAVASLVAAIALTSFSMTGIATARKLAAVRTDDSAWLALAAITRDLYLSRTWAGCVDSTHCTKRASHRASSVLQLEHAIWFAEGGLKRCATDDPCEAYLDGVTAAQFIVDFHGEGGTRREPFAQNHGTGAEVVEVILSMKDRHYARTTRRPGHDP